MSAALILGSWSNTFAQEAKPNPPIIPPNASAYGMTYGEWSAKWWVWAYSMPVDHHPLYETADCSAGQLGKVWFLGGTYTASSFPGGAEGSFNRTCTVPTGTALFFPIINSEAATLEGDGEGYEALLAKVTYYQNAATDLYATIDGVPIQNLQSYRVQSPLFQYGPLPPNNIPCNNGFGLCEDLTGKTSDFVADGVFLMLPPLSVGTHEIAFGGKAIYLADDGTPFFTFTLNGVYEVIVKPGQKK